MSSQPLHTRVHDRVETAFTISGIRSFHEIVWDQGVGRGLNGFYSQPVVGRAELEPRLPQICGPIDVR